MSRKDNPKIITRTQALHKFINAGNDVLLSDAFVNGFNVGWNKGKIRGRKVEKREQEAKKVLDAKPTRN